MPDASSAHFRNDLLSSLADEDLRRLAPLLESATLEQRQILERPHEAIEYVYFPESGIASVIAVDPGGRRMEAGPFGREGMSALALVHGTDRSPHETLVQVPGLAHRIPADKLRQLLAAHPSMHRKFLLYAHAFSIQTAHTALATGLAVVEQRLARWILMLHDRIDGDELPLTHEFMALMLAVRRPGVTVALHVLEGEGLIRSRRGLVIVRDREGLEKACGHLYGVPEAEYRRLILKPA